MKKIIYFLTTMLLMTVISCGEDDPVIPRDRDITFSMFELFHIAGTQSTTSLQQCGITLHRKELKADITIRIAPDGEHAETFALTGVPMTYDEDKNVYNIRTASTNQSRITNLIAKIDCNDYIADMAFVLDGKQVTGTSNEIFYGNTSTAMTYSDNTSYKDLYANYIFELHPDGDASTLKIGNLTHSKDVINYPNITLNGLKLEVTTSGYHVSSAMCETTDGQYSRYDPSTGSPTTPLGDSLFLRFEDVKVDLNVIGNSMSGSWTMVRLKRVTDTIQKTPELKTQQRIVEVNRTRMTATGTY